MTVKKTQKLLDEILDENEVEIGIFISLLSYNFIRQSGLTKRAFLKALKNSLKICEEEDY